MSLFKTTVVSDRLGACLPKRKFGRADEWVTQLGVGGFHVGKAESEQEAQAIVETALEEGIRFFDMAAEYQDGRAEHRYGEYLCPKYRDDVFLMTKTKARTGAEATAEIESSLRRMRTDRLDAILMHAIATVDEPGERIRDGVYEAFLKAKEQGKVRYLGFSGHLNTDANLRALELLGDQVDVSLMPVNVVDPSDSDSFVKNVLPVMNKMGVAPLSMKSAAFGHFFEKEVAVENIAATTIVPGRVSMEEAFQYVLSTPISVWVSGMHKAEFVKKNAEIARNFSKLDDQQMESIVARVEAYRDNVEVEGYRKWG
ncbi:aldo/keto reductase [Pelagicoccus mobilis]|uniref:Aldo/keto reductase n=1 Tax=Pelagicoccus mobilis TaxID=415221 RepID=A0A934VQH4_9BACT|nr:aldo/keto reductase [Pelagicoccus mobilis]MBK1876499.1 aldo/keto reductase [Pelagicoccus mobilis]